MTVCLSVDLSGIVFCGIRLFGNGTSVRLSICPFARGYICLVSVCPRSICLVYVSLLSVFLSVCLLFVSVGISVWYLSGRHGSAWYQSFLHLSVWYMSGMGLFGLPALFISVCLFLFSCLCLSVYLSGSDLSAICISVCLPLVCPCLSAYLSVWYRLGLLSYI